MPRARVTYSFVARILRHASIVRSCVDVNDFLRFLPGIGTLQAQNGGCFEVGLLAFHGFV